MKKFTVKDIISWKPCFNPCEKFGVKEDLELTALDVLRDERVKDEDKLWCVLRIECIDEKILHLLACDFAESVLQIFEDKYPEDKRPRKVIEIKRLWIDGKATDKEIEAARDAAWDAAWDAAGDAAWAARAAWDAARATALDAVIGARGAAWDAAVDADKKFVEMCIKRLEGCSGKDN